MQLLVDKRVLSDYRCPDERSVVTGTADLYQALGDAAREKSVSTARSRTSTAHRRRSQERPQFADNLRVYLERAAAPTSGRDAVKLIRPTRRLRLCVTLAKILARAQARRSAAVFEQGGRSLRRQQAGTSELWAKSLQALNRATITQGCWPKRWRPTARGSRRTPPS